MKLTHVQIIGIIWICIFGFIVYKRNLSYNVLIICGLLITLIITFRKIDNDDLVLDKEKLEWLDTMLTTKDVEEKRRCHHILNEILQQDSLFGKTNKNNVKLLELLEYHKLDPPFPVNDMI